MRDPIYIHAVYIHIYRYIFILMQGNIAIIYDYVFPNVKKKTLLRMSIT